MKQALYSSVLTERPTNETRPFGDTAMVLGVIFALVIFILIAMWVTDWLTEPQSRAERSESHER